jgi:hypothetical protein
MKSTKQRLMGLALLSLASITVCSVHAEDSMTRATPTNKQLMKDCIRKHETSDVNMSKSELNRLCKDELKQQKVTGSPPPPALPTDGPQAQPPQQ